MSVTIISEQVNTGFNGSGFFDNLDHRTKQWFSYLISANEEITLRFRANHDDFQLNDLTAGLTDLSYSLEGLGKHLKVIYTCNTTSANTKVGVNGDAGVQGQFDNIEFAINNGIDVIGIEFDNETYSGDKANFIFDDYLNGGTPNVDIGFLDLFNMLQASYPDIPCFAFLAPRPVESGVEGGSNLHSTFNNDAIEFINATEGLHASIHIYFSQECPVLLDIHAEGSITYDPQLDYPDLRNFYTDLFNQTVAAFDLPEKTIVYCRENLNDDKLIAVSEWGYNDYGQIKNTLGTSMMAWMMWNTYGNDTRLFALLQHNGIGGSDCMISNATARDANPNNYTHMKRMDYHLYKMWREISDEEVTLLPENLTLSADGTYRYWYVNFDNENYEQNLTNLTSLTGQSISADEIYKSSGDVAWMANDSVPTYEIEGAEENEGETLPLSFGYITATIGSGISEEEPDDENTAAACDPCYEYTLTACQEEDDVITIKAGLESTTVYDWYVEDKFGKIYHNTATTNADGDIGIPVSSFPEHYFNQFAGLFTVYFKAANADADHVAITLNGAEYTCIKLNFQDIETGELIIQ